MGRRTIVCWRQDAQPLDWSSQDVVIVASGPSAARANFELVRGRARVIVVNSSWRLVPWADLLFASDGQWWAGNDGARQFTGRKMTSSIIMGRRYEIDVLLTNGNNSGIRAIRLAEALHAKRVLLVGYDMHTRGGVHWHEPHRKNMLNPTDSSMLMWIKEMERSHFDIEVINCTPGSALKCFPMMKLHEVIDASDDQSRADQSGHRAVLGQPVA